MYFLPVILSALLSFIITPWFIKYFQKKKLGQTTREDGPLWHEVKMGTPTMGGAVFVSVSSVLILSLPLFQGQENLYAIVLGLTFLLFGAIGFADDFISIFKKQNEGLTAKQKFLFQMFFAFILVVLVYLKGGALSIPFFNFQVSHVILVSLFAMVWLNGFSNAVNLTDGLDGLATGLSIIAYGAYALMAHLQGKDQLVQICLIILASLLAFLFYNRKPAKIFMGDVGSLALGAGLAMVSLLLNNPWSLLVIGLVFVLETLSVILQVWSFKKRGKRIFKMSPIHHHFEMSGWSETKVVKVFWLFGFICSSIYIALYFL